MWDKENFPEGTIVRFLNKWSEHYVYGVVETLDPPLDSVFIPVRILKYTPKYLETCVNGKNIHTGFYANNLTIDTDLYLEDGKEIIEI